MSTQQPEALAQECADYATSLRSAANVAKLEGRAPPVSFLRAADLFERAASRIAALESQLAQRFDAADMATAAAQGFRDGVASVSAGWQSIETAPKDGQAILVTDGMDCYCVEWDEEFDWWTVDDNKLGPFRLRGSSPTHWIPLPAAPSPADGESNV